MGIDNLLLGEYTLNNNAKYITVTDSMSQDTDTTLIFEQLESSINYINASSCIVSLSASAGNVYPPVSYIWFDGEEEISTDPSNQIEFDISALTDDEKNVTVIAESVIGRSAIVLNYYSACFPSNPVSQSSVTDEVAPPLGPPGDVVPVPFSDQSESNGNFSETDPFISSEEPSTAAMSGGIIAATVAGSFFGLLLIGAACYFLCCKTSEKTVYKPNDKGSDGDYDITASVDLDDVIQAKNTNNSNPVKRSMSGTWNKPNNSESDQLIQPQSPKRTISTQTLEGKNETIVFGSSTSVHV